MRNLEQVIEFNNELDEEPDPESTPVELEEEILPGQKWSFLTISEPRAIKLKKTLGDNIDEG